MSFIVVFLCLVLQRYLQWYSFPYSFSFVKKYFQFMCSQLTFLSSVGATLKSIILIVPVLLLTVIVSLFLQSQSSIVYFVCSALVFWYVIDYRDLTKKPYDEMTTENILLRCYGSVFAIIFWYAILGLFGLALYVIVCELLIAVGDNDEKLHAALTLVQAVMDWLPVRLLGLTFALVSHFSSIFSQWLAGLTVPLTDSRALLVRLSKNTVKDAMAEGDDQITVQQMLSLLDRAMVVWLVVLLIVVIAGAIS